MSRKFIIILSVLFLVIGFFLLQSLEWLSPRQMPLGESKNADQNDKQEVSKSNRKDVNSPQHSTRKGENSTSKYHSARIVNVSMLSPKLISKIQETIAPVQVIDSDFERNKITTTYREAMGALNPVIGEPARSKYPHSYCEGEKFFLVWGTHTNTPERGFAVSKANGKVMVWDVNNDHIWEEDGDDRRVTTDHKMVIGYFFEKEYWNEFRAKRYTEEERHAAAWKEHLRKRAAERRKKKLGE